MKDLPKIYNSKSFEDKIYLKWEESGFFNPDNLPERNKKSFTISLPPPNVTGQLHLGHAAMLAYQDTMTRYHRLIGDKTLWLPGMDHAAIATQSVVEKKLNKKKKTRHDLGREKFLKERNNFAEDSKKTIRNQIKKMGSSLDWSREHFTLDEDLSIAVKTVFKKMYDDGLIYKGDRVVNWCPTCQSTLADDEVEYVEKKAPFYYFKYGPVIIGTARPETKFSDKVIIVHPKDKRYKDIIGKEFNVEWIEGKIKAKVIADIIADMEIGTGAMTITPAHSMVDFELAQKYDLKVEKIIDKDGKLTSAAGSMAGLDVEKARKKVVEILDKKGLVHEIDNNYTHNLSICYRCSTPIEPLPSKQWFVDVNKKVPGRNKSLKQLASEVVESGEIKMIPNRFNKTYFQWMDNLRDWCISRQIWYGHRIPVWYKEPIEITYFVHGTTPDNEKSIATGLNDVSLSELGIKQSKELKKTLKDKKFDVIITSDLKRATESANYAFGKDYITDKRLREINYGDMTGKSSKEVYDLKKETINEPYPNGESHKNVEKRMRDLIDDISKKYKGKKIAIIAHQATQQALDVILKGKTWKQAFDEDWRNTKAWQPGWKYKIETDDETYVGLETPKGKDWIQDEDTLDTWFSSSLWTFSTLGWPEKTNDLKTFHPTQVMETGYDILFFWVARMIIMSTYVLEEIPFHNVYLHGLIRDKEGKKMSKSLGNGIDPLEMIDKYGADALRLSMIVGSTPGNDLRLYEEKIQGYRNFINKLWNISRYILTTVKKVEQIKKEDLEPQTMADYWILNQLNNIIDNTTDNLENFKFSQAGEELYEFTWNKLANWYIEIAKIEGNKDKILLYILEKLLILWHPMCPFISEVIWEQFNSKELLIISNWPNKLKLKEKEVKEFDLIQEIISAIRNARAEHKANTKKTYSCSISTKNQKLIEDNKEIIEKLGKVKITPKSPGIKLNVNNVDIILDINESPEVKKNKEKSIINLERYIGIQENKLKNKSFSKNAPPDVILKEEEKLKQAKVELEKLTS